MVSTWHLARLVASVIKLEVVTVCGLAENSCDHLRTLYK